MFKKVILEEEEERKKMKDVEEQIRQELMIQLQRLR